MKEKISLLIRLQDCDTHIQKLYKKKEMAPRKTQDLEKELQATKIRYREDKDKLESLKKERRKLDQDIDDFDIKIEKSGIKLSNIKSNKEYTAALKEVDDLKDQKFRAEDKAIGVMEEIEEVQGVCRANEEKQKELEKQFEEARQEIQREMKQWNEEIEKLEAKRTTLKASIEEDLLKRYLFLWERKQGVAVSPVVGGVCQTCHMGIPPQRFNELRRGDALMSCSNCKRIIYWADDEHYRNDRGSREQSVPTPQSEGQGAKRDMLEQGK